MIWQKRSQNVVRQITPCALSLTTFTFHFRHSIVALNTPLYHHHHQHLDLRQENQHQPTFLIIVMTIYIFLTTIVTVFAVPEQHEAADKLPVER